MHTFPTLEHLLDNDFDSLLRHANLSYQDAADLFGRSLKTIYRWRHQAPPSACRQLVGMAGYLEVHGSHWQGWRIHHDHIETDAGVIVRPGEIRALPWLWAIRAEVLRSKSQAYRTIVPMAEARLR